ncbi:MAG: Na-translocating system protein MpsC family protein [Lacipirellulaceae bacterium]
MEQHPLTIAEQLAAAAKALQLERTGHAPRAVTVVLSGDTLVMTLHDALTPAERSLAQTPEGAAQVQDFHRRLFDGSSNAMREIIQRLTGRAVRGAAAEVEPATGAVVHAFTSGAMVHVFLLSSGPDVAIDGLSTTAESIQRAADDGLPDPAVKPPNG